MGGPNNRKLKIEPAVRALIAGRYFMKQANSDQLAIEYGISPQLVQLIVKEHQSADMKRMAYQEALNFYEKHPPPAMSTETAKRRSHAAVAKQEIATHAARSLEPLAQQQQAEGTAASNLPAATQGELSDHQFMVMSQLALSGWNHGARAVPSSVPQSRQWSTADAAPVGRFPAFALSAAASASDPFAFSASDEGSEAFPKFPARTPLRAAINARQHGSALPNTRDVPLGDSTR